MDKQSKHCILLICLLVSFYNPLFTLIRLENILCTSLLNLLIYILVFRFDDSERSNTKTSGMI